MVAITNNRDWGGWHELELRLALKSCAASSTNGLSWLQPTLIDLQRAAKVPTAQILSHPVAWLQPCLIGPGKLDRVPTSYRIMWNPLSNMTAGAYLTKIRAACCRKGGAPQGLKCLRGKQSSCACPQCVMRSFRSKHSDILDLGQKPIVRV